MEGLHCKLRAKKFCKAGWQIKMPVLHQTKELAGTAPGG